MVTTTWLKEAYPGSPSLWAIDNYPWLLALPWQVMGQSLTVWTKEF